MYERQSRFINAASISLMAGLCRMSDKANLIWAVATAGSVLAVILPSYLTAKRSEAARLRAEHEELQAMEKLIGRKLI
jgi:hypothetical protein